MKDQDKTKAQLISELKEIRRLVSKLEESEAMLKKAQGALKDEAIRRRILVEQSRDGIVVLGQDGEVYEANQRFADMLGYSLKETLQLHVWDWDTQFPKEQLLEMIRTVGASGDHFETRHRKKDGTFYDVEISTNGTVYGGEKLILCICRDITERKQMEEALKDEAIRRRILVERSRDGIFVLDQDGKVYESNQRYADMLGYSLEETLQLHAWDWEAAIPREELQKMIQSADGIGGYFETRHRRKDGTFFDGELSVDAIMHRGQKLYFCICRDVTEHKKAQEALRASEQKYRDFANSLPQVVFETDRQGILTFINSIEILGYARDDFDRGLSAFQMIIPEDRNRAMENFRSLLSGETLGGLEFTILRKDGSTFPAVIHVSKIMRENLPVGMRGIVIDITERKQAEEALKKAHNKLEERVQERTAELAMTVKKLELEIEERKRAQRAAEAANIAKSNFLATMSHELRTPLNHIIGFTELLVDKKFGDLNEQQAEYLNDVLQSGNHLLFLVNDILELSRVEGGNEELKLQDINLKALFENSLTMIKEKAQKHRIKLLTDIDGAPETIKGDERKLKQIFYNLLSNAVKFTPDGGTVTACARTIEGKDEEESSVEISIGDTGIGIKEEDIARIFDPFEQANGSASRRYEGTGLGLSLAKSLVELHGGKIWAESEGKDKGSTFRFIIPIRGSR